MQLLYQAQSPNSNNDYPSLLKASSESKDISRYELSIWCDKFATRLSFLVGRNWRSASRVFYFIFLIFSVQKKGLELGDCSEAWSSEIVVFFSSITHLPGIFPGLDFVIWSEVCCVPISLHLLRILIEKMIRFHGSQWLWPCGELGFWWTWLIGLVETWKYWNSLDFQFLWCFDHWAVRKML